MKGLKLRAYWPNREPQLGICEVVAIDFRDGTAQISNGSVLVFPQLSEIELIRSTGHSDRNGTEICEGDVLRLCVGRHVWFYQVVSSHRSGTNIEAVLIRDNLSIDDETDAYTYEMTDMRAGLARPIPHGCEVVGNIYQHPHLLEHP